ncbi:hypothetical protein BDZ89DRAFT_1155648 [Hymenopellis radicata]|nr:hypothetical protein BDZ89DRAFT_1155648 [Hymenopellis radicata]
MQTLGHRRRSQSASTASSPIHRRSTDTSRRGSTKRAQPHDPFNSPSPDSGSPYKWNVEDWRSKRRRREYSPSSDSPDDVVFNRRSRTVTAPFTPAFPATSADFHLFPNRSNPRSRRRSHRSPSPIDVEPDDHLTSVRSAAYRELHRSVADNGEGFVRCMRDYERSRSRVQTSMRGRRTSSLQKYPSDADESDADNDVHIFSGDVPAVFTFHPTTSSNSSLSGSVNTMSGTSSQPFTDSSEHCSSPTMSSASSYISDDDHLNLTFAQNNVAQTTLSPPSNPSQLPSSLHQSYSCGLPSTRSEKALAALTLAMANGAGSIHDYDALRNIELVVAHDDGAVGELWR